jgi:predicted nucleic acid-binding protein
MIFVDTNIIIDLGEDGSQWQAWSLQRLAEAISRGPVVINAIVFAELSSGYKSTEALESYIAGLGLTIEPIPRPVLFRAGQVFAKYRRSGGPKLNVLPDFFVGAHAEHLEVPLLTRDTTRYRTYFPQLELIAPEPPGIG